MKKTVSIDDWKYSNQKWIKVLNEIWTYAPNGYGRGTTGYNDDHPLAQRLKIKGYDLNLIMSFLEDHKLIEYELIADNENKYNWIKLTSKGFDVALQNRNAGSTNRINRASLYLSLVIALVAFTNLLIGIPDIFEKWITTIILLVAMLIGANSIKKM
jgi:hypothetical protein